jgi:DNA-binding response OmpR family regulator
MELLETTRPDMLLLDLDMPRMDGFEVLARLRASPEHARTPVIVATGREDVAAIDRAFQAGATGFVVKPLNWRLLSYQIRYVDRTHRTEMALVESERTARAALNDLCLAGSRFMADALGAAPRLKDGAGAYLGALEGASRVARSG